MATPERTLLTGTTGFVGSRIARRLFERGAPVRSIVRRAGADPSLNHPLHEEIVGDFIDPSVAARAAAGCAAVIHAAATGGPDLEPVRRVNVEGTVSMLEAAKAAGASRFIHISTVSVYDVRGLESVDEGSPLKIEGDPYGVTKAEGDRRVLDATARGLSATILRPSAILGVHPTSTWAVVVPRRVRDRQMKLLRGGGNTVPFVHVEDLVDAVLLAIQNPRAVGRTYNVLARNGTWREYTDEVRSWFGTPPLDEIPDAEAAGMTYWTGSFRADRIAEELAWRPARTYEEGMEEAAREWRGTGSMRC
ncbi:MAG TPA: NAD-dependent epimerase/dehydratase family protein [Candidatus Eisenbacteria bacterium]|nr:NAD-dependent epimerase/dehydratase family protein [Candidatus Eisenbacteria bacterium]